MHKAIYNLFSYALVSQELECCSTVSKCLGRVKRNTFVGGNMSLMVGFESSISQSAPFCFALLVQDMSLQLPALAACLRLEAISLCHDRLLSCWTTISNKFLLVSDALVMLYLHSNRKVTTMVT